MDVYKEEFLFPLNKEINFKEFLLKSPQLIKANQNILKDLREQSQLYSDVKRNKAIKKYLYKKSHRGDIVNFKALARKEVAN